MKLMFYSKNFFGLLAQHLKSLRWRRLNIFSKKGFTLIELLIVIAIVGLLSGIVVISSSTPTGQARDAKRIADLKEISKAIQLYWIDNGHYPREADGANGKVGEGAGLDSMLAPYMKVPHDPRGPGNSKYYYYYDGAQWCKDEFGNGRWIAVIFARTMETQSGNGDEICPGGWGGEGGAGNPKAWHIYIGPSDG